MALKDKISVVIPLSPSQEVMFKKELEANKDINVYVEIGTNPSKNRNIGARKANAPLVAFINAHTSLAPDWAKEVKLFFDSHPEVDIVGGPQLTHNDDTYFAHLTGSALNSFLGAAGAKGRYGGNKLKLDADESDITSANLVCKRKVFSKVRFDESLYPGEDPKFISDAKAAGFSVAYSPKIVSYNIRRPSFFKLAKQIFNYGKTRAKKESLLATLKMPYFLVPSAFLLYLIVLPTLAFLSSLFLLPLYAYLALLIAYSVFLAVKRKDLKSAFIFPFIFATVHLAYGAGFIYGTIAKERK